MQKKNLLSIVLFLFFSFAFAQSPRIRSFEIKPSHDLSKVQVIWVMEAGSTCPSLSVERSNANSNFKVIYTYPSVCGNSDSVVGYAWIDSNPPPYSINYYRLNLDNIEFTKPILFENQSRLSEFKILAFPNPSSGKIAVEFRNPKLLEFDLQLYSSDGKLILEKLNNKGNTISIKNLNYPNDLLKLKIKLEDNTEYFSQIQFTK